ncbi:hypothetical protein ATK36_3962 [Amycolatopsis sulphurea]|uniref:Uncharacterized protein n=2 Tax=Amycolatopsis sulphurea TaxID=76022 RepID=A0A2A9FBP3_9PSEU|nr:hypothetical protein ATK36_3962 [Amycolatopsis sulphurea]
MKAAAVLQLARAAARHKGYTIEERRGRGKSSHMMYVVVDKGGAVARFALTGHSRDVSIGVLRAVESGLSHLFGEKWMEKR